MNKFEVLVIALAESESKKGYCVLILEEINSKKLVGINLKMSLAESKIVELWSTFMPRLSEINNIINPDLYSLQVYSSNYFDEFNPKLVFEQWALIEVENFDNIPDGMKSFVLPEGLYAVFLHKGMNTDNSIFQYIYGSWLPNSAYQLDSRPHFELLGSKYKNGSSDSEEEIWIPIQ